MLGNDAMNNGFKDQTQCPTTGSFEGSAECRNAEGDVETRLSRIWQELLGVDSVGLDENYFDLGGDSALTIQLFVQVEKVFKVKIPMPTLFEAPTVREFARVLRSAVSEVSASPLVPIQPAGSRPRLFCVHGMEGDVSIYRDLSRHLPPDQPVYGLQSQGLDGIRPCLSRIEDMAELYLSVIRNLQPHGPYFLAGYRFGGTIALEMAQQLQQSNEVVALLALLDTINWSRVPPPSVLNRGYHWFQQWKFRSTTSILRTTSEPSVPKSPAAKEVWESNNKACSTYVPQPYAGAITDFRPEKQYRIYGKPEMKWDLLAKGGQEVVILPVSPENMLLEPFVKHLAVALNRSLDAAICRCEGSFAQTR